MKLNPAANSLSMSTRLLDQSLRQGGLQTYRPGACPEPSCEDRQCLGFRTGFRTAGHIIESLAAQALGKRSPHHGQITQYSGLEKHRREKYEDASHVMKAGRQGQIPRSS